MRTRGSSSLQGRREGTGLAGARPSKRRRRGLDSRELVPPKGEGGDWTRGSSSLQKEALPKEVLPKVTPWLRMPSSPGDFTESGCRLRDKEPDIAGQ